MAKKTKTIKIKKDVNEAKYVIVGGEIKKAIRIGASPVFNLGVKYKSAEDTEFYVDYDKQFDTKEEAKIKLLTDEFCNLDRELTKERADREYEQGKLSRDISFLENDYQKEIRRLTNIFCALFGVAFMVSLIAIILHFIK